MPQSIRLLDDLHWAPGAQGEPPEVGDFEAVVATDLCGDKYHVIHYDQKALGRAFGPLPLRSALYFCVKLQERLQQKHCKGIWLVTLAGDVNTRANVAVMLGAYLLLNCGWKLEEVRSKLPQDAGLRFACSWAKSDRPKRLFSVDCCWAGIEVALSQNWLDRRCAQDVDLMHSFRDHDIWLNTVYDASWLLPGKVMVSADPVSTVMDPNPATCTRFFPKDASDAIISNDAVDLFDLKLNTPQTVSPISPEAWAGARGERRQGAERSIQPANSPESGSIPSCDTVIKAYNLTPTSHVPANEQDEYASLKPPVGVDHLDFVTYLKQAGVKLVVQANYMSEPGLPQSYNPSLLISHGVDHCYVPCDDFNDGMHSKSDVNKMITACEPFMHSNDDAVLFHCKGGFGRSVVLACQLIVNRYQIPGYALLGWFRLVRPGVVNTPYQEQFLASLKPGCPYAPNGCCSLQ